MGKHGWHPLIDCLRSFSFYVVYLACEHPPSPRRKKNDRLKVFLFRILYLDYTLCIFWRYPPLQKKKKKSYLAFEYCSFEIFFFLDHLFSLYTVHLLLRKFFVPSRFFFYIVRCASKVGQSSFYP